MSKDFFAHFSVEKSFVALFVLPAWRHHG